MSFREIPYNYTSLSDKKIIVRLLDQEAWDIFKSLKNERKTGLSAKMFFEIFGDIWIVYRNLYIQEDLIQNPKRIKKLIVALQHRLNEIKKRTNNNILVLRLTEKTKLIIDDFSQLLLQQLNERKNLQKVFSQITSLNNIRFDPLTRSSHSTDATDWRVEYPLVVLTPSNENEVGLLVKKCIELKLNIIPRGGGTGYTGGVIPLTKNAVIINTEKLLNISQIQQENGIDTITVGAGVITKRVSEKAKENNLIFAIDPTSQDACTIGGNIAMNAGGKKALRYGTTVDNLLAWTMFLPNGKWLKIKRLNHNKQKLHLLDSVQFETTLFEADNQTKIDSKILTINGKDFRNDNLGKDVSNKFLSGLPGVQKEGCDGLITSATFVLHKVEKYTKTICLEFFDNDLHKAVPSIVNIIDLVKNTADVELVGLEHLDHRYIKAVNYSTKSIQPTLPKMVLIGDISSNNLEKLQQTCLTIIQMVKQLNGEGFIAKDETERQLFWKDRANTAAIASHTNAFKINEDVVIPLNKLADYSDHIEKINIRLSIENKLETLNNIKTYLEKNQTTKVNLLLKEIDKTQIIWQDSLNNLDKKEVFRAYQTKEKIISYKKSIVRKIKDLLIGEDYKNIVIELQKIHKEHKQERLFVATHMHAGDGNVHTNIPVHSHNQKMLNKAEKIVDEIMQIAKDLGGSISGEHGIGITKYKYLNQEYKDNFATYKKQVDPHNFFNKNKLLSGSDLEIAYTPSLQLLAQEALIMENSQIGEINHMIKDCLRCGKCKPVCTTHIPEANLLYSPRDKIIGTNLLIEAFLYEEQTRRGISLKHIAELEDISDHCTICHRCEKPCPVDIDFGKVSIKMRDFLVKNNYKTNSLATKMAYGFLNITNPLAIKIVKKLLIDISYRLQRWISLTIHHKKTEPNITIGKPTFPTQVITTFNRPLTKETTTPTMRQLLDIESSEKIAILSHPTKSNEDSDVVFYFPGCGSERLFSQIGLSTLALLYENGTKIVLPPGYLCCGYPQNAGGYSEKANEISTKNRVLFHRIANTLNYLNIKTVITSCGTCIDQLLTYQFGDIFHNSRLIDIHEFLLEKNIKLNSNDKYLYHAPCHDPIKSSIGSEMVINQLMGIEVINNDRCCSEAGTFAVSRPDVAKQVSFKKENEIKNDLQKLNATKKDKVQILTTCPACRQGLSRYENTTGVKSIYPIEIIAKETLGNKWLDDFVKNVNIEQVLL
ncbi:FAD/FMN-containing dehydrogenases [hydrothermal vent metagenome]|uniref:FAD/FMN-containing dehydrogenases n=1 Tax=hydrothermal vent metagenome TaxID=652676 RepID=A0A1W1CQA0_9ZZZZ